MKPHCQATVRAVHMTSDLRGYSSLSRLLSNPLIVNACQGLYRPGLGHGYVSTCFNMEGLFYAL